jgi:aminodeoxyfutalosine synthase
LQELADLVARGGTLGDDDASTVAASHDLIAIGMMADEVRRQLHGTRTTFLRVFEMHVDAIPSAPPPHVAAGEFRIVGAPRSADAACAAVAAARVVAGSAYLTGFSLHDLQPLLQSSPSVFDRLRAGGLDAVAECSVESADAGAIAAARTAGLGVQRLTVAAVPRNPVALVGSARRLQTALGGFRVFAPLPRSLSVTNPTTGYDDVKLVALARMLVREIPSIQVDWPLYGPKLAQVGLTVGADDVDGIQAVESGALGTRRSALEEIKGNIRAAGLEPVERDGRFEVREG